MCQKEAIREHAVQEADVGHVLSALVRHLDTQGRLDAPAAMFRRCPVALDALCSVGLLSREDGTLAFAHQSYFDYLVAEQVLTEATQGNRDPIAWVRANQSLFRRDQLRQLLCLLRDCDAHMHADLLRSLLHDDGIRFHLRHLALGLLRQADPVLDHEGELVIGLCRDPAWCERVFSEVVWGRPPWFDKLAGSGALKDWLDDSENDQRVRQVLRFLRSVAKTRDTQIDQLLAPYWGAGGRWDNRLVEIFSFDPCDDSPRTAELRSRLVRSGVVAYDGLFMNELAKHSPERLVRLVEAATSCWVQQIREHARTPDNSDVPAWRFRDDRAGNTVLDAIRANGQFAWDLLKEPLRTIARLRELEHPRHLRRNWARYGYRASRLLDEAHSLLGKLVIASVEGIARDTPLVVAEILDRWPELHLRGLERAVAKGLAAGDPSLADRAVQWLCDRPTRFRLGDGHDELYWAPARDLVNHFASHCSEPVFARLESAILAYHDDSERRSFQFQLAELRDGRVQRNDWGRA